MPLLPPSLAANATAALSGQIRVEPGLRHEDGESFHGEAEGFNADTGSLSSKMQYEMVASVNKFMQTEDMDDGVVILSQKLENEKIQGTLKNYFGKKIPVYIRELEASPRRPRFGFYASVKALAQRMSRQETSTRTVGLEKSEVQNNQILKGIDAFAQPGEIVLVLGRPGSGCTTLLQTIANEKLDSLNVTGRRVYAGSSASQFAKEYAAETAFCSASDIHIPSLTVGQTLGLDLDLATPSANGSKRTHTTVKEDILSSLLALLGLNATRHTFVGDARIRGISGGERKRVSLAEAWIARAAVTCFDNPTLGLDAGSAAKFIHTLKILTMAYDTISFVTLYQASDMLFDCFNRVILLEGGEQLYFGSPHAAIKHFEKLGFRKIPGQSKADFLTDCIDPRHKQLTESSHISWLKTCFRTSDAYTTLRSQLDTLLQPANLTSERERLSAISDDSHKPFWMRRRTFTRSFPSQVLILAKRHWMLKFQDRYNMAVKNITSLIVALVLGAVYWDLPQTSSGAFTRGGIMFIALLYTSFTAFVELPLSIFGRPVLYKQSALLFYRRSALPLGQMLVDLPILAIENLVFSVVVYFMAGLHRTVDAFFTFYLFIVLGQTCATVFFRALGATSRDLDAALKLACIFVILFVLESGYLIPYKDQRPWVKWFSWVDPTSYAFSGMMWNEFSRITMTCEGTHLIPNGDQYTSLTNRVCTLAGAESGTNIISGSRYLQDTFGFEQQDLWRNVGILFTFFFGLLSLNFLFSEFVSFSVSQGNRKVFRTESKVRIADEENSTEQKDVVPNLAALSEPISWQNLNYEVPIGSSSKQLLFDISGVCQPGRLLGVMGASGGGKSTFLDVIAQRKSTGTITGDIRLGGEILGLEHRHRIGYCEQIDILDPHQTVKEALEFSALLRRDANVPREEKLQYVKEIMDLLGLETISNAFIGDMSNGLSVEERKRVSMGIELVAQPGLLLLDECTSGLDSQSAMNIVRFLRRLADAGQAIICTIHQPSADIFNMFDDLLLLHHGHTVYYGETSQAREHFASNGFPPPRNANVAEFMLRSLTREGDRALSAEEWHRRWEASESCSALRRTLENKSHKVTSSEPYIEAKTQSHPSVHRITFMHQLLLVTRRTMTSMYRQPGYYGTRLFNHFFIAVLTGLAYLDIGDSLVDVQYRIFVIFQVTVLPSLILSQVEPRFEMSRIIFFKEELAGMYSKTVFLASMVISEVPISLLCSVVFFLLLYYPANFSRQSNQAGYQFLMIYLTEQFSVVLGQAVATITPSSYTASLFTPFLLIVFSLFCGITVPPPNLPNFTIWVYHLNPLTYLVGGMIETELHGGPVRCKQSELSVFQPPTGQTCFQYASSWLQDQTGYLQNPNSTSSCGYCPYSSTTAYASQLGLLWSHRWRDLGLFAVYIFSSLVIIFVAGTRLNWFRR